MKTKTKHWASITAGILSLAGYASAASGEKYTYDASGNIIEKSIDGQVTTMAYDQANHLIGRQADGQGKEITTYDVAGRPIALKDEIGLQTRGMSYGYGDKVLGTESRDAKAGFYYNAEGQLIGITSGGNVATYTWDGNVLAATSEEAYTNESHVTGGVPIIAGNQIVVVSDYLGNTLSQGNQQFTSTAYGDGLESGRFTGKPFVKELDTYIFHHRLYSKQTSRWNTTDPLGFPDGLNNYAYVGGDPLCHVDPQGTFHQLAYVSIYKDASDDHSPAVQMSCNILFGHTSSAADEPNVEKDSPRISAAINGQSTDWTCPTASVEAKGSIQDVDGNANKEYWNNVQIKGTASYTIGTTTDYSKTIEWKTDPWEK